MNFSPRKLLNLYLKSELTHKETLVILNFELQRCFSYFTIYFLIFLTSLISIYGVVSLSKCLPTKHYHASQQLHKKNNRPFFAGFPLSSVFSKTTLTVFSRAPLPTQFRSFHHRKARGEREITSTLCTTRPLSFIGFCYSFFYLPRFPFLTERGSSSLTIRNIPYLSCFHTPLPPSPPAPLRFELIRNPYLLIAHVVR